MNVSVVVVVVVVGTVCVDCWGFDCWDVGCSCWSVFLDRHLGGLTGGSSH